MNFFLVTSFNPYFVGKIARAFSLVRFESSKKVANFVFVKTSNGHNFCSGYQNRNYYICIWGRKKFLTPWQPAWRAEVSIVQNKRFCQKFFIFQVLFNEIAIESLKLLFFFSLAFLYAMRC